MSIPTPPYPLAPGQGIFWSTPTSVSAGPGQVGATNGSATATLSSAALTFIQSRPLGNWYWAAVWSNFTAPSLPAGSVINAIYPVLMGYGSALVGVSQSVAGPTTDMYTPEPAGIKLTVPLNDPFSGEFTSESAGSLGTTSAAVTSTILGARLFSTLFVDGFFDAFSVTYVGLAVYYTPGPVVFGSQPILSTSVGNTRVLND